MIHYQIPASVDIYVHRSGRTARGDADGLAVALVAPKEAPRYAALQQVDLALCTESQIIPVTERSKKRENMHPTLGQTRSRQSLTLCCKL